MQQHTRRPGTARPLIELVGCLDPGLLRGHVPDTMISGLAADSREVEPGDLFVATRGGRADGHRFLDDAARRGASAAVVQERPAGEAPLPLLQISNSRRALAELAAAWYDHPADATTLVGVTGTMGKTSTLSFLESILRAAGQREGSIGSLGIRSGGSTLATTGYTVPGPLRLHESLSDLRDRGCDVVVMEATTHAMTQDRLHGVRFDLGVFTGLSPLEHMEYHDSFRDYAEAKLQFFQHLRGGVPLVYYADCPVLRAVVPDQDVVAIACGQGEDAAVRLEVEALTPAGTSIRLWARDGVPRLDGSLAEPFDIRLRLPLVGRSAAINCLLAAGAAAALGADAHAIRTALSRLEPAPRRMQVVQTAPFVILDDFGGHPDTMSAVFEVVDALRWRRLHVVSGYRASRGPRINQAMARALAIWLRQVGCDTLCLTAAEETADERNRALPEEQEIFQAELQRRGVSYTAEDRLDRALDRVLPQVSEGDLLVILGTQGMDGAAARARQGWRQLRSARSA